MIIEQDLQAAIAECEGERNPNANTCIKLAAFYTIRDHLFPQSNSPVELDYSYDPPPETEERINLDSDTEFSAIVNGRPVSEIMPIMDEAMDALKVLNPSFYASVIRKIEQG